MRSVWELITTNGLQIAVRFNDGYVLLGAVFFNFKFNKHDKTNNNNN